MQRPTSTLSETQRINEVIPSVVLAPNPRSEAVK